MLAAICTYIDWAKTWRPALELMLTNPAGYPRPRICPDSVSVALIMTAPPFFLIRNEAQPAMPQPRKALNFAPSPAGLPSNRTSNARNAWRRGRFRDRHGHWLSFVSNQAVF